jgi:hypothetical protein
MVYKDEADLRNSKGQEIGSNFIGEPSGDYSCVAIWALHLRPEGSDGALRLWALGCLK